MDLSLAANKHLADFDLTVDIAITGDRIGVFGPSGSGKSTLVGMLAGFVTPDHGEIVLDGECLFSSSRRFSMPPGKRRIALVFQQHELFPHLNVRHNLLYGYNRCAPECRHITLDRLVDVLQLGPLLERSVETLSGGEKQRVAIGRAILSNPRLLLLDEPLSALDDKLKYQIISYLKAACATFRIPYLFISHSLVEMRLMADTVLTMGQGRIIATSSAEELARQRMGTSAVGYINLLPVQKIRTDQLSTYAWGSNSLQVSAESPHGDAMLELSSRDIILCKEHPGAISARNLLHCTVTSLFTVNGKAGVELDCNGETLIAEIVTDAASELGLGRASQVYAAIKASAFRVLH